MIHGDDPFKPTDDKTLEENIVKSRLQIPLSISFNAYSLIGRLLQKKPTLRISSYKELASHKFFNDV
ncbi:hypothetical protein DFH28DRAFT_989692 [Melampsora americana]|nr:hypothetical protein DFH28DRAFT_989692 [Melampsora americana]